MMSTKLERPLIDLELCGMDSNIAPIAKVNIMDEDSFEQFTLEWLYGCKKSNYDSMERIGGSGDKGRDVIGRYKDGSVDYFQCKHYREPLTPSNYYLELGKLCYYTFKKEIRLPKKYFIIASNDVGISLKDLIDEPPKLLLKLKENWNRYCKNKISKSKEIKLENDLLDYVNSFDFTIIEPYPIQKIIDEYLDTIYGYIRFGGRKTVLPTKLIPGQVFEDEEMPYINALLEAYSDKLDINSILAIVLSRYMYTNAKFPVNFLVLDSPILSLKETESIKPTQTMRHALFENIVKNQKGIQTIIIENEIPDIDYKNVNLIYFTKDRNSGRYGFLCGVED